ncbi:MAG: hypothetical protein HRU03_04225 [Nanoarchaeales archaeon]|nr:hypothetical protein [Nanoarchaeales archaeon]
MVKKLKLPSGLEGTIIQLLGTNATKSMNDHLRSKLNHYFHDKKIDVQVSKVKSNHSLIFVPKQVEYGTVDSKMKSLLTVNKTSYKNLSYILHKVP